MTPLSQSQLFRITRVLCVTLSVAGCSKSETAPAAPATSAAPATAASTVPAAAGPLKVGFAYVGPVGDAGWTFAHDKARKQMEEAFAGKVKTSFVESVPEGADAERVFRDMVSQGTTLIFGTTFGYMEPMLKVAADEKKVKFEHATGYKTGDNMRTYDSKTYEGAYMAGVPAGAMTKTGTHERRSLDPHPRGDPQHRLVHLGRGEHEPQGEDQGGVGQQVVRSRKKRVKPPKPCSIKAPTS